MGVDGNLHFPIPSINRLNQTELATFSIVLFWTFFRHSVFLYFMYYVLIITSSWNVFGQYEKKMNDMKLLGKLGPR
jgi:hypothetical protein